MGGRLKVDLGELADTAAQLRRLSGEFGRASKVGDAARWAVGHDKVADAVGEFTGNWRRHRDALRTSLEAVADMAQESHRTYRDTDRELAKEAR